MTSATAPVSPHARPRRGMRTAPIDAYSRALITHGGPATFPARTLAATRFISSTKATAVEIAITHATLTPTSRPVPKRAKPCAVADCGHRFSTPTDLHPRTYCRQRLRTPYYSSFAKPRSRVEFLLRPLFFRRRKRNIDS